MTVDIITPNPIPLLVASAIGIVAIVTISVIVLIVNELGRDRREARIMMAISVFRSESTLLRLRYELGEIGVEELFRLQDEAKAKLDRA